MKRLTTLLGVLSGALAALVARPVTTYRGFLVKSTATAHTPALALLGTVSTVLGLKHRSPLATISGMLGAGIGAYYIRRVIAPHGGLERAFGPGWERRIPPATEQRMLRRRLTWRLPRVPDPCWTRDVPFGTIPGTDRQLLADTWEPPPASSGPARRSSTCTAAPGTSSTRTC